MIEKIIENWLINTNENNYRVPFIQVLISEGYRVFDTHGPLEVGKDILAVDKKGNSYAFQLKKGDIDVKEWEKMIPQIHSLVYMDINHPFFANNTKHIPILVTNGNINNFAVNSIKDFNKTAKTDNKNELLYYDINYLMDKFIKAHEKFMPEKFNDFYLFLDLLTSRGDDFLLKEKFMSFLDHLLFAKSPNRISDKINVVNSSIIIVSYLLGPFQSKNNYFAIFETWNCLLASIVRFCLRTNLPLNVIDSSIKLIISEIKRNINALKKEALNRKNFAGEILAGENLKVRNSRILIVLGTLASLELYKFDETNNYTFDKEVIDLIILNIENLYFWGESAIPFYFNIIKLLEINKKKDLSEKLIEHLFLKIIDRNNPKNNYGLPNPYYGVSEILEAVLRYDIELENIIYQKIKPILSIDFEKMYAKRNLQDSYLKPLKIDKIPNSSNNAIFELLNKNILNKIDFKDFCRSSYFLDSIVLMLVRRNKREFLSENWKKVSYIHNIIFEIDYEEDLFTWRTKNGELKNYSYDLPCSFKNLEKKANDIENSFYDNFNFLPFFILTFPHRFNTKLFNYLDIRINSDYN